jgi:hypothetical protein
VYRIPQLAGEQRLDGLQVVEEDDGHYRKEGSGSTLPGGYHGCRGPTPHFFVDTQADLVISCPDIVCLLQFRNLVRQRFPRLFLLVLLVTVLAKGVALLPAYAIDDYTLSLQEVLTGTVLRQGRFGQSALLQLLDLLQLEPSSARVFFVSFALVVSSLFAALVVRYWNLRKAGWLPVAAAAMISVHPFTTEVFTFRTSLGIIMCAFALFALLLVPRRWSPAGVLGGAAVFALALSIYQAVLHYCLIIVLLGTAIGLTRLLVAGSASGWPARVTSLLAPRRIVWNKNSALLACAALGTILYTIANAAIAWALRVTMVSRTQVLSPGRIGERVAAIGHVLSYRFLAPSPLLGRFSQAALLLLLVTALAGLTGRARPWLRPRTLFPLLAVVLLLAASLVWTVGIIMVLEDFWPAPRVMSHIGVFWAGALAIACQCAGARVRQALGSLSLLVLLSFIGSDNRILGDQIRLNLRDRAKASRILARIEAMPGFSGTAAVAVHGATWTYPLGFGTSDHDMNISAFGASWAKVAILREISGYDLKPAESDAQKAAAAAYCRGVLPWPGPESVVAKDGLVIICLELQR